jgi:DedD protein
MEQGLKERLTGAAVIVILAVIFIPMLLDDTEDQEIVITETNIPPKPENMPTPPPAEESIVPPETDFSSRIIPVQEAPAAEEAVQKPEPEEAKKEEAPVPDKKPETSASEPAPVTTRQSTAAVSKSEEPATNVGLSAWVVQLGSFSSEKNAQDLNQKLKSAGFRSFVEPLRQNNTVSYRVRVGPELKRSDAQAIRDKLKDTLQLEGIIVAYP